MNARGSHARLGMYMYKYKCKLVVGNTSVICKISMSNTNTGVNFQEYYILPD